MSATGTWDVQSSVFSLLTGDLTLMGLITGVFDGAPDSTQFPYIDIGDGDEQRFRTFGSSDGHRVFITPRIWTQDDKLKVGYKEGLVIWDRVQTLLEGVTFAVSNHTRVLCNLSDMTKYTDTDGITRCIVPTYEVIAQ